MAPQPWPPVIDNTSIETRKMDMHHVKWMWLNYNIYVNPYAKSIM